MQNRDDGGVAHYPGWQVELLANLARVPVREGLILVTWPTPLRSSGFSARCIALVEEPLR
jgi:kynurenine formamidase